MTITEEAVTEWLEARGYKVTPDEEYAGLETPPPRIIRFHREILAGKVYIGWPLGTDSYEAIMSRGPLTSTLISNISGFSGFKQTIVQLEQSLSVSFTNPGNMWRTTYECKHCKKEVHILKGDMQDKICSECYHERTTYSYFMIKGYGINKELEVHGYNIRVGTPPKYGQLMTYMNRNCVLCGNKIGSRLRYVTFHKEVAGTAHLVCFEKVRRMIDKFFIPELVEPVYRELDI
jgi:hypothetical protein